MKNYAFIDSQNLNLGIRDAGWKLDYKKFFIYLREKYEVKKIFLFLGYIQSNKGLYEFLRKTGYKIIFKPTLERQNGVTKGNCDSELVLHCLIHTKKYSKAIIVSGDGDFYCLLKYLVNNKKLLKIGIPNKRKYSTLLRKFRPYFFYICDLKHKLEYKKRQRVDKDETFHRALPS
ncbi:MAG: NYN domain-containing protein [Candidatus Peregrinibacteria bacterium]